MFSFTYNQIDDEAMKQANQKLSAMSESEIANQAELCRKKARKSSFVCSLLLLPFPVMLLFLLPQLVKSNDFNFLHVAFLALTVLFILYEVLAGVKFCKRSNKEIVLEYLKQQLLKKAEKKVEIEEEQRKINDTSFQISRIISIEESHPKMKILVDDVQKQFILEKEAEKTKAYSFSDIINYEIYENGKSKVQGRAGSALIGGAFFGIGGLIIGSSMSRSIDEECTQLKLIIRINDPIEPQIAIDYVVGTVNKSGNTYRKYIENLQSLCSHLEYMINSKTLEQSATAQPQNATTQKTPKEQLQELKEMLDSGLITQEDYELKKKQILGL